MAIYCASELTFDQEDHPESPVFKYFCHAALSSSHYSYFLLSCSFPVNMARMWLCVSVEHQKDVLHIIQDLLNEINSSRNRMLSFEILRISFVSPVMINLSVCLSVFTSFNNLVAPRPRWLGQCDDSSRPAVKLLHSQTQLWAALSVI